jgi:TRAP-type mannitol/chloroaromatic compound transport system permease small subunit
VKTLSRFADFCDALNRRVGQAVGWLALVMVLVGAFNAVARYLGRFTGADLASNAYIELQWYLFSALFLLGAADALREGAHVRVDVLYQHFSPRVRAAIDLGGTLLFLLPFCALVIITSLPMLEASWSVREQSPDPGGLARYPIKTLIPLGFALLALQGLAHAIRQLPRLAGVDLDGSVEASGRQAGSDAGAQP